MKKIFFTSLFLFFLLLTPTFAQETINDFRSEIKIEPDSSLIVTETISYDFGAELKHGIYRDIPYKYDARGGNFKLRLEVISVTDETGEKYNYAVSNEGRNKRIKIGDADVQVSGQLTYVITYRIKRAINYLSDQDELYWNVTGNDWQVPITQAITHVILPSALSAPDLKTGCFMGAYGTDQACISQRFNYTDNDQVDKIVFTSDKLEPGQGFTIVVGLPKGAVNKPTWFQNTLDTIKDNIILILPLMVLILMHYLWKKYGRDPEGRGTIIAQFDAPDDLTPAEVGTIIDERAGRVEISAEIIYLASRGFLKIEKIEGEGIFKKTDYQLTRLKDASALTNKFDQKLLNGLFYEAVDTIKLSSLKEKFYQSMQEIKKLLYQSVTAKQYFAQGPEKVRISYLIAGLALFSLSWFSGSVFGWLGILAVAASGLIVIIYSFFMPSRTIRGVAAKEYIQGLKEYMKVAEKDRINFHNAPEKNPKQFEKLLPYAMVLGVEKEWAKQFEGIYNQSPSWYSDPNIVNFNSIALAHSFGAFSANAESILTATPSSASGGGSGFTGGGVGGGFGGGGGGSW